MAAALLILFSVFPFDARYRLVLFLIPYLTIGWDVLKRAGLNMIHGQVFDENFLMSLATVGAFAIGEYPEGVFVMLFYQVGELFQDMAVDKSRESISDLMEIMPEYANLEVDGVVQKVEPGTVEVGQVIVVKAGEKIPLDGTIIEGNSSLNTVALTGEAAPKDVGAGDEIVSGCVNLTGLLRIRVSNRFEDSTVSKIMELVEHAASNKAKTEKFITKFSRYYTPIVVFAAVIVAVLPSIITGNWNEWIYKALSFLVISCPCALVLSVPLSFFGGIGGASRRGILVKGANYLEVFAQSEVVAFDKTGTLTKGTFVVSEVHVEGEIKKEDLLELAALAETYSNHPIAESLQRASEREKMLDRTRVTDTQVLAGKGVMAVIDGKTVLAGNQKMMEEASIAFTQAQGLGTVVYVAVDGHYAGHILISDEIKENAASTITKLKNLGISKIAMLTGDSKAVASQIAKNLAVDETYAELLPAEKVSCVEKMLEAASPKGKVIFVGDGINDAPVLSRADVGIAMGAFGSDAAIEAADIVLMDDDPARVVTAVQIAKKTVKIAWQNIVFSLAVKVLVLILAVLGLTNMWHAVLADVGVAVVAILNAVRTLYTKNI